MPITITPTPIIRDVKEGRRFVRAWVKGSTEFAAETEAAKTSRIKKAAFINVSPY
jgi:hypothetical protein